MQKLLSSAFLKVVEGQGVELSWYRANKMNISEKEYYDMVGGKTGALVALSCEIGASVGGADKKTCGKLKEFGYKIGVAFQIQDDVLNVTGDFDKYKKEIGGDITEGKRTLMLAKAFGHASKGEREELERILLSHTDSKVEISKFIGILEKHGAIGYARSKALELVNDAKNLLSSLPDGPSKRALVEAATFSISREV
jgi:geranylgeranyl pyrophosphate synthase